jgi:hypothetical protein
VDVADRRRGERPTLVRAAALVAVVVNRDPVVDRAALPLAVGAAAAQLGIEGVERLRRELADLQAAQ